MLNTEQNANVKKPLTLKKKNRKLVKTDFANFDPTTGEKIASHEMSLAKMEAYADARQTRRSPSNKEETLKDAATGGSLAFLVGNSAISSNSKRIKALTSMRKKGLIGIAGALGAGALSQRKQKSEYNRQQASRELLSGKHTGRSDAYHKQLSSKYNLEGK
jgi:hypothetical protein